jgi:hypothetical protein
MASLLGTLPTVTRATSRRSFTLKIEPSSLSVLLTHPYLPSGEKTTQFGPSPVFSRPTIFLAFRSYINAIVQQARDPELSFVGSQGQAVGPCVGWLPPSWTWRSQMLGRHFHSFDHFFLTDVHDVKRQRPRAPTPWSKT